LQAVADEEASAVLGSRENAFIVPHSIELWNFLGIPHILLQDALLTWLTSVFDENQIDQRQ
jgi:hypothetical protein